MLSERDSFQRLLSSDKEARAELETKANELREVLRQRDSEAEELRAKSQMLSRELEIASTRSQSESSEIDRLKQQLAQKDEEVAKFGEQMAKMSAFVTNMESGLAGVSQMRQQLETALQAQQLVGELQARAVEKDSQIQQLSKDTRAKDEEIAQLRDALNARADQIEQLQNELAQPHPEAQDAIAEAEVKVLQGKLSVRDQQIDLLNSKLSDMHAKLAQQLDTVKEEEEVVSETGNEDEGYLEKDDLYAPQQAAAQQQHNQLREVQDRLERAREDLRERDRVIMDLRKRSGSDQINLSPTPTQSLSPLHSSHSYLAPPPAHPQSPSRAVALEALEQDLFELQRGLARYRSRSPARSQSTGQFPSDESEADMERRIRNQVSKQIREEMEADFRDLLKKELEHRNMDQVGDDRFAHSQVREDLKEEVRRELREELTMRELGKNLATPYNTTSIYNTSPTHTFAHAAPLAPPQLNTSPTRYRTVMHSPAPSPPTLYPSPPHQSQAQSQSQSQARTRSPARTANGATVHADLARTPPKFETDYLNWRHKSPSRKSTLEEVERDLEQLRRKHQQQQLQKQQTTYYQPNRSTLPTQKGTSTNPYSISHSHSPTYYDQNTADTNSKLFELIHKSRRRAMGLNTEVSPPITRAGPSK